MMIIFIMLITINMTSARHIAVIMSGGVVMLVTGLCRDRVPGPVPCGGGKARLQ